MAPVNIPKKAYKLPSKRFPTCKRLVDSVRKLKVLWLCPPGSFQQKMKLLLSNYCDIVEPKKGDEEELRNLIANVDLLLIRRTPIRITQQLISAGRRLKLVQKVGVRCTEIDLNACQKAGITVANMFMGIDVAVAEHTISLMLALCRKLIKAHRATVNGEYEALNLQPTLTSQWVTSTNWMQMAGLEVLYQKTLGVIGLGEIGMLVAKRARAFGMKILYYDALRLSKSEEQELGVRYCSLRELLEKADFVTLHIPHNKKTEKMIGKKELSLMKPSAFLINTSRGGVIDEDALYEALRSKQIKAAALDVFREEPTPKDNPLLKLENIVMTPHIAASLASDIGFQGILENVLKAARGEVVLNKVI